MRVKTNTRAGDLTGFISGNTFGGLNKLMQAFQKIMGGMGGSMGGSLGGMFSDDD